VSDLSALDETQQPSGMPQYQHDGKQTSPVRQKQKSSGVAAIDTMDSPA